MMSRRRLSLAFAFAAFLVAANWGPGLLRAHAGLVREDRTAQTQPPPEILKVWVYPSWHPVDGGCGFGKGNVAKQEGNSWASCYVHYPDTFEARIYVRNFRRLTSKKDEALIPARVLVDGREVSLDHDVGYPYTVVTFRITTLTNSFLLTLPRGRLQVISEGTERSEPVDVDFEAARRAFEVSPEDPPRIIDVAVGGKDSSGLVAVDLLVAGLVTSSGAVESEGEGEFILHPIRFDEPKGAPASGSNPTETGTWVRPASLGHPFPIRFTTGGRASAPFTLDPAPLRAWLKRDTPSNNVRDQLALDAWRPYSVWTPIEGTPGLVSFVLTVGAILLFRVWRGRVILRCLLACEFFVIVVLTIGGALSVAGKHADGMGGIVGIIGFMMLFTLPALALRGAVIGTLMGLGFRWARQGAEDRAVSVGRPPATR
jgi:hypothetical protein